MPRLPTSDNLGGRPTLRPQNDVISIDDSAVGRATVGLGQVIAQVGEQIEKKSDEQAVFEARRKLDEWERKTVYDPENGVVSKRGADALSLPGKVTADFDKFADGVGQTLGSNRQREVFREMSQSRRNQVADFTTRHALQQKEVYERGQVNADMIASGDRAVLLASNGDPSAAKAELDVASARLANFLGKRGASGEEIAGALKENSSKIHSAVVQAMVNKGDPVGAKAYLDANGAAMLEADKLRVNGMLKEGVLRAKSQAFADEVMSQDLPMGDALAKAREKFTGDEEVAATHEIKTRYAEKEASKAQTVKGLKDEGWSVVIDRGTKGLPPALVERLRVEAPEELRQMRDWEQAKWRQAKADAEGKDQDPQAYYGLRMMAADNPAAFGKLDLMKSQPMMSKQHWNHLVELQGAIGKGDLKAMESQATVKRTVAMVKNEIGNAGIDLTITEKDKGSKKAKDTEAFFGALTQALDAATATKGKPLTDAEARAIGMNQLREGYIQGSGIFFDTKKRSFQVTADEADKFVTTPYSKIPPKVRAEIEAELPRETGIYGNAAKREARVERIYQRALSAGAIE